MITLFSIKPYALRASMTTDSRLEVLRLKTWSWYITRTYLQSRSWGSDPHSWSRSWELSVLVMHCYGWLGLQ